MSLSDYMYMSQLSFEEEGMAVVLACETPLSETTSARKQVFFPAVFVATKADSFKEKSRQFTVCLWGQTQVSQNNIS